MKSVFKSNIVLLARIKIFTLRDLRLFLLGIIFISMTSGAISAFMLGLSEEEFFIGEADNILIVAEPGITTPFTGKVPESLQNDINKIKGVVAISPETLGLSVAQNLGEKSIVVRGITSNFPSLTSLEVIKGSWFDPRFGQSDSTQVNGAMIGHLLATDLDLSPGDHLQLASTLTDMVIDVVITGIIRSNSPIDEELLVSLSLGKTMRGKGEAYVSFLRVLINEEILTKETLSDLINQEFTVPIRLITQDPQLAGVLVGTTIVAYTPYGTHVETQTVEEGNRTEFQLRFGTYEFVATASTGIRSSTISVFVNQSITNPIEMTIGRVFHSLQLNITINHQPAYNASVILRERLGCCDRYSALSNEEGIVQFFDIPENIYNLRVYYNNLTKSSILDFRAVTYLEIELESSLSVLIMDVFTGQEVQGGIIQVFDQSSMIKVYHNNSYYSGSPFPLNPGTYLVNFQHKGVERIFSVLINGSVQKSVLLGNSSLTVWVRGENEQSMASANVTIDTSGVRVSQAMTDDNGTYEFELEAGLNYTVTVASVNDYNRIQTQEILFSNVTLLLFDFLPTYSLDIFVRNGTINNSITNAISGCNVTVLQNGTRIDSAFTNSSGPITFNLSEAGIFQVIANKEGFHWNGSVEIRRKNMTFTIPLGNVHLLVSTQTISGSPVVGADISLYKGTQLFRNNLSNSSGMIELVIPVGNYSLKIKKGFFSSEDILSFPISQSTTFTKTMESCGDLTLRLTNQFYQKINRAYIILNNDYYVSEYEGFSNTEGEITFFNIPWGNYTVQVTFEDEAFPKVVIEHADLSQTVELRFETYNPIVSLSDTKWQSTSFSVVLSSQFVSGFLETTLAVFTTVFTALVIIVSVLSLLSIATVISHPIVSNEKTLTTFEQLGATRNQVIFGVVTHLSLIGILASGLGALFGMGVMTFIPTLSHVNVGGVIIRPKVNIWLFFVIVVSNLFVISIKAAQKVDQIYSLKYGSQFLRLKKKFYNHL